MLRPRLGFQADLVDRLARAFADAVSAVLDLGKGGVDLTEKLKHTARRTLELTRDSLQRRRDNAWIGMKAIVEAELAMQAGQPAKAISLLIDHEGRSA